MTPRPARHSRRKVFVTALLVGLSFWPSPAPSAIRYVAIDYVVTDHPDQQSLHLSYMNNRRGAVCLGSENWPTADGIIDNNGSEIYLEVGGIRYFLDAEEDYCSGGCVTRVRSGRQIEGRLNYAGFHLPEAQHHLPKSLHMTSIGYAC